MRLGIFTTGAVAVLAAVSPGTYAAKEADTEKVEKKKDDAKKDASRVMNRALGESAMSAYIHDAADGSGLQEFEGKLVVRHIQDPDQHHEPQLRLMFPNGIPANIINLPPAEQMGWRPDGATIMVKGQFTKDGSAIDAMGNVPEVLVEEDSHITGPVGNRTILMVLVSANDSDLTDGSGSLLLNSTVSTAVFGSGLSASSQIAACSYDELTLLPDPDFGAGTTEEGTATLHLDQDIIDDNIDSVEDAITMALNTKYGVTSPAQLADHVMYCVPPGTVTSGGSLSWLAYAYSYNSGPSFHWLSVYNNDWCLVSGDVYCRQFFFASIISCMPVCDESLLSPCLINSICLFLVFPRMLFCSL